MRPVRRPRSPPSNESGRFTIQGVAVLRGLAAHGDANDLPPEEAMDYLALIDAVLFAICQGTPKQ
jgi:hypothetical protein